MFISYSSDRELIQGADMEKKEKNQGSTVERKEQGCDFRLGLSNWPLTAISSSDLVNSDHQRTNQELEKSLLIPKKRLGFFPPFPNSEFFCS